MRSRFSSFQQSREGNEIFQAIGEDAEGIQRPHANEAIFTCSGIFDLLCLHLTISSKNSEEFMSRASPKTRFLRFLTTCSREASHEFTFKTQTQTIIFINTYAPVVFCNEKIFFFHFADFSFDFFDFK